MEIKANKRIKEIIAHEFISKNHKIKKKIGGCDILEESINKRLKSEVSYEISEQDLIEKVTSVFIHFIFKIESGSNFFTEIWSI